LAGKNAPDADGQVVIDLDGVLVIAHSDKQDAAPTWKKTYGHHPLTAFLDHGPGGTGEPVAALLRPGNAGSNSAADHITTAQLAIAWVAAQGHDIVPLVGAKTRARLQEALGALDVTLSVEDLAAIEAAVPRDAVRGDRYPAQGMASLDSERG